MKNVLKVISLIGAALMLVGTIFPWAKFNFQGTVGMPSGTPTLYGWDAGGIAVIGIALAIGLLAFVKRRWTIFPALVGFSFFVFRWYDFWTGTILSSQFKIEIEPRFGFYLAALGCIISLIAALPPEPKENSAGEKPVSVPA